MKYLIAILLFTSMHANAQWRRSNTLGVDKVADLRMIRARPGQHASTAGMLVVDDKKGSSYRFDSSLSTTDDGLNYIRLTSEVKGGWVRIQQVPTIKLGFGIKLRTDSITADADTLLVATIWKVRQDSIIAAALANTKQPAGNYLTSITSSNVTTALGYTPLQSSDITGKKDKSDSTAQSGYVTQFQKDTAAKNLRAFTSTKLTITDTAGKWQPIMSLTIVSLPNITLTQTAVVAIAAGVRKVTVSCTGLQVGDRILLTPTATMPTGYGIHDAVCVTAGTMEVTVNGPLLAIGASYSITCKTTVFR